MSFFLRPLPNFDAILAKEKSSALILTIVASISVVQVMLLGNPPGTAGLMMPDDSFNLVCHLFLMSFSVRPLPNFNAIFEKETQPLSMLSIDASTSADHLAIPLAFAAAFAAH
jgi:hypothetical protein